MPTTSKNLIKGQETTLQILQNCTANKVFPALARVEQTLSIKKSLEEAPLLRYEGTKIAVVAQIIRVIEFFLSVTGKDLDAFQIQILAGDLYEKFCNDTLDDIILMFKMARNGDFGKVYNLDNFTIMDWANKYLEMKSETRERLLRSKRKEGEKVEGKYFADLPAELQEKYAKKHAEKPQTVFEFLRPAATEALTQEKHRRDIKKQIEKEEK